MEVVVNVFLTKQLPKCLFATGPIKKIRVDGKFLTHASGIIVVAVGRTGKHGQVEIDE